jgi:5-(carboxyamino)imidazole ribonucleotide synthase
MSRANRATIAPPARLGVIGGGQLGRMFIQAAQRMGYRVVALSETDDSPAAQVANDVIVGDSDDGDALGKLASAVEAVTVEFENVSASGLRWLGRRIPCRPGWRTVWTSQNRLREKTFLTTHGFPVAPWMPVRSAGELEQATATLGTPLILKTANSGYDGKGQVRVERFEDRELAWNGLNCVSCAAEGVVTFAAEVSVIVTRGVDGSSAVFPVFWNRHSRHILDLTVAPAPIGPIVTAEATRIAREIADALETVGLLTVEFFVSAEGALQVNELAPRPHNSGHLTIEACPTSQFEQQVRALCGLPLGSTELIRPAAMANILGDEWRVGEPNWADALAQDDGLHLHLYGKEGAVVGRKMGHLTALDSIAERAAARVTAARGRLCPRG